MVVGFNTTCEMQSVPITTKVVNLNPTHGQVGGFLRVTEILLKVAFKAP
jgi:hypothetical protein